MRILVTGATGQVGRHLVAQLHEAGHHVRALSRTPAKADLPTGVEVVAGDLTDAATLGAAFEGVDAIHLITFGGDHDLTNGPEIIDLAARHGITRATVLSGWSPTSIESALESSAIRWTLLQPAEFMCNALEWADEIRSQGTASMLATFPSWPPGRRPTTPRRGSSPGLRSGARWRPSESRRPGTSSGSVVRKVLRNRTVHNCRPTPAACDRPAASRPARDRPCTEGRTAPAPPGPALPRSTRTPPPARPSGTQPPHTVIDIDQASLPLSPVQLLLDPRCGGRPATPSERVRLSPASRHPAGPALTRSGHARVMAVASRDAGRVDGGGMEAPNQGG